MPVNQPRGHEEKKKEKYWFYFFFLCEEKGMPALLAQLRYIRQEEKGKTNPQSLLPSAMV